MIIMSMKLALRNNHRQVNDFKWSPYRPNSSSKCTLSDSTSIFNAEMTAMISTLNLISKIRESELVVYFDSYGSTKPIEQ